MGPGSHTWPVSLAELPPPIGRKSPGPSKASQTVTKPPLEPA
jgi:hypothetical protein